MVIGLLVATAGCKKDDDDTPAHHTGGSGNIGGEGGDTHTGGQSQSGGVGNEGGATGGGGTHTGGNGGQAGSGTTGGVHTTGGNGGSQGGEPPASGGTTGGNGTAGGDTGGAQPETGGVAGALPETGGVAGALPETGGTEPTGDIDEVITEACGWEFRCCDTGEQNYRLSPYITSADECISRFVNQLHNSNATNNPYGAGVGLGMLGTLGYVVDLDRVAISEEGVAECVESLAAADCTVKGDATARCTGPGGDPAEAPCALSNLFSPALEVGDECTLALAQGGTNDIECPIGSTCLPANDPDNTRDYPACVSRGLEGDDCTEDDDCDFGFYCADGNCGAKAAAGEDCSFNEPDDPQPGDEDIQCQPGLSCNPVTLKCEEACTENYICNNSDLACPSGYGCAPIEVAEDTSLFTACRPLGDSAQDLCNTDGDCDADFHCDGTRCQADVALDGDCAADNECAAGLYCPGDDGTPGLCTSILNSQDPCTATEQCGPDSAGCLNLGPDAEDPTITVYECRTNLLTVGQQCGADATCASKLCEVTAVADEAAGIMKCTLGADVDDDCDDNLATAADGLRCAAGLLCWEGTCIEKALPGTSCINPDGDPDVNMCVNGSTCDETWNGEGEICNDWGVPEVNGGTGLTCDGE